MSLPPNYHRDWQQTRAKKDPEWYNTRKLYRSQKRRDMKSKAVVYMGNQCAHCKQSFPDCCYDFHHKDPTQINDIPSSILHCSWKRVLLELEKCIMLCANCHRKVHNIDGYIAHDKRNFDHLKERYAES